MSNEEMKADYETLKGELAALRITYNTKADDWIREKLKLEMSIRDLQSSISSSAGEGWDVERERFKVLLVQKLV